MTTVLRNALSIGSRVDYYTIESVIGHGGFGISYRAVDTESGQRVALKEYLPTELATREADDSIYPLSESHLDNFQWGLERFLEEVELLTHFRHPNIVHVERAFKANGTAYMVMAYEDGESLAARLKREGTLTAETLTAVIMPLLDGLELVHEAGFIHRDIKPSNIYLRQDGSPVLLDFGSARQALKGKTRTLTALVSAGYAPLEQYFSRSDLQGPWTDIYGLGATLYHAISGEAPIDAVERSRGVLGSTRDILPSVAEVAVGDFPPCLLAAVDHALRGDDQERPRSIDEWRRELNGEVPVPESLVSTVAPPETRAPAAGSRHATGIETARPSWRRLGPAAALVALAIVSMAWWQWPAREAHTAHAPDLRATDAEARSDARIAALRKSLADSQAGADASRQRIDELIARLRKLETTQASASSSKQASPPASTDDELPASQPDPLVDELKTTLATATAEGDEARRKADELAARVRLLEALRNQSSIEDSAQRQEIDAHLAAAESHIRRLRLTTPAGNNAYEQYRRVLALEKNNANARRGLERIVKKYIELAGRARDEERFDDAGRYLDRASIVLPSYASLAVARQALEEIRRERRPVTTTAPQPDTVAAVSILPAADTGTARGSVNAGEREYSKNDQSFTEDQAQTEQTDIRALNGPTSKISIAIFPGSADFTRSSPLTYYISIVGENATALVGQTEPFDLHYSYYADAADNKISIPDVEGVWKGFGSSRQLDDTMLLALAAQHGLDAVLVYTLRNGVPRSTWGGGFARLHLECQIFDIESSEYVRNQGDFDDTEDVIRGCLSSLQMARGKRNAGSVATADAHDAGSAPSPEPPRRAILPTTSAANLSLSSTPAAAHLTSARGNVVATKGPAQRMVTPTADAASKPGRKSVTVNAKSAGSFGAVNRSVDAGSLEMVKAYVFTEPARVTLVADGEVDLHPHIRRIMGVGPDGVSFPRGTSGCHLPLEESHVERDGFDSLPAVMQRGGALFGAFAPASVTNSPNFRAISDNFPRGGILASDLFLVGSRLDYSAREPGTLFLGINDCNPSNNSGSFSVVISATH